MTLDTNSDKKAKNYWTFSVLAVLVIAVVLVLLLGNQRPASSTQETEPVLVQGTALVTSGKELVATTPDKDFSIYVPPDLLDTGGSLVVVAREPNLFPEKVEVAGRIWLRPRIVNVLYRDSNNEIVDNPVFEQTIELCFYLNQNEWARYLRLPDDHQIQYYEEKNKPGRWVGLKTYANEIDKTLCAEADHLTLFALSIRGAPMPVTEYEEIYRP